MSEEFDRAIARARIHLEHSLVEGLEAANALFEAATVASGREPEEAQQLAGEIARAIRALMSAARSDGLLDRAASVITPIEQALAAEIKRWEERSKSDPGARPVLRAFLALREMLWEFGVRAAETDGQKANAAAEPTAPPTPEPARPRVQRFDIEED